MSSQNEALPPKQLSMTISAQQSRNMPGHTIPDGFDLRGYRAGDEDSWVALINRGQFDGAWDRSRFDKYITEPERVAGSRLVVQGSNVIAATFASVQTNEENMGRVDFVVSDPGYRGLGLGRVVCTEVVQYLVGRGYSEVILFTDDWRLPAIGLYLSMGFEPRMNREDMPRRWEAIKKNLEAGR